MIDKVRIAVARDKAFCFYYQENIEELKANGADIVEFSPIADTYLPENIQGIYFGGGYPELFAQELSDNRAMLNEVKQKSMQGMPIYGECGGFMYLCSDITGMDIEKKYPMTSCFPFSAIMSKKMRSLGYREIKLLQDTLMGKQGDLVRGHEFHYSSLKDDILTIDSLQNVYSVTRRDGQEISVNGYEQDNTLGSYLHIHFGSNSGTALSFVKACAEFKSCY